MLSFETLDRAARMATAKADPDNRQDVYQDAWVKFLRFYPRTFTGARIMAHGAMIDQWRREKRHRHLELYDVIEEVEPPDTRIEELRRRCPVETAHLLDYYSKKRHTGAERARALRTRRRLRRRLR